MTDKVNQIRTFIHRTYLLGAMIWIVMWGAVVWLMGYHHELVIGLLFPLVFFLINALMWHETIGTRAAEQAEVDRLERNAFYAMVPFFALSTLMASLRHNIMSATVRLLIMAVLFIICIPMTPLWMSTSDPVQTIKHKHVKSIIVICGMGFMVMSLATLMRSVE